MLALEAITGMIAYFSVIAILLLSLSGIQETAKEKTEFMSAKSNAVKCAAIADSVYSNPGTKTQIKESCFTEKGKIKSIQGKTTAKESILGKAENTGKGIEINEENHYRKRVN